MVAPGTHPPSTATPDLDVAQARAAIAAELARAPALAAETVPLGQALGRVLADDLPSPIAVPAHDNAAMDGYAFAGAALAAGTTMRLQCVATVLAGAPRAGTVGAGQCVRIMTGAVMPAGCDTVVPQELCSADGTTVEVPPGVVRAGDHRRRRGEDLAPGQAALRAGRVLRPADLGLAASLGLATLTVRRRLRVAVFSTGSELRTPGHALDAGCLYDSNRPGLVAALQRLGLEVLDLGLVRDDPAALQATLADAVARADVVLTSGGVGVGDADHTRALLQRLGEVAFWKVAMRPGRPFAFGALHAPGRPCWLFALPGNPVAALVSFYVLVREPLLQLAGAAPALLPLLRATSRNAIRKRPGRAEFQRATLSPGDDGRWQVEVAADQGSGILRSLSEANALVVLGTQQGPVAAGEAVDVWLFDGLV